MAAYIKTITTNGIMNGLNYRGHSFAEIWKKDILWECGMEIKDQVKAAFEETTKEELSLIKELPHQTDAEVKETIDRLTEIEAEYAYNVGSGQKERSGQQAVWKEHLESRFGKVE